VVSLRLRPPWSQISKQRIFNTKAQIRVKGSKNFLLETIGGHVDNKCEIILRDQSLGCVGFELTDKRYPDIIKQRKGITTIIPASTPNMNDGILW
jgi:hypothetical protein